MLHVENIDNVTDLFKENQPFVLSHDFGLSEIMNVDKILKDYGKLKVIVPEIVEGKKISSLKEMNCIEITIEQYVKEYINKKNNKYYLRSENPFGFVHPEKIVKLEKAIVNKYNFGKEGKISLWWGGGGTITPLHYDSYSHKIDQTLKQIYKKDFYKKPIAHSLLSVVSGRKEVLLIEPKYNDLIESLDLDHSGAMYSKTEISEILIKNNIKQDIIILNENQSLNIPRFWWHRINNIKQGISITYNFKL